MLHHIFVSYSHKDSEIMMRIRESFYAAGLTVWTDEGIEPGTPSWKLAIEDAILVAGCLVVLLSPDAANSKWVRAELDFAEMHGKPIFLILIRGEVRESVPFGYSTSQWVDVRIDSKFHAETAQLNAAIRKRLNVKIEHELESPLTKLITINGREVVNQTQATSILKVEQYKISRWVKDGCFELVKVPGSVKPLIYKDSLHLPPAKKPGRKPSKKG